MFSLPLDVVSLNISISFLIQIPKLACLFAEISFSSFHFSFLCSQFSLSNVVNLLTFVNNILNVFFVRSICYSPFLLKLLLPVTLFMHILLFSSLRMFSLKLKVLIFKKYAIYGNLCFCI